MKNYYHIYVTHNDANIENTVKSKPSALESLPKDIFNHTGLYLDTIDCASGLSHCNHNIHKMVLSKEFISFLK